MFFDCLCVAGVIRTDLQTAVLCLLWITAEEEMTLMMSPEVSRSGLKQGLGCLENMDDRSDRVVFSSLKSCCIDSMQDLLYVRKTQETIITK